MKTAIATVKTKWPNKSQAAWTNNAATFERFPQLSSRTWSVFDVNRHETSDKSVSILLLTMVGHGPCGEKRQ
jgi:hypothetical protein